VGDHARGYHLRDGCEGVNALASAGRLPACGLRHGILLAKITSTPRAVGGDPCIETQIV
jgi:hypothetical protein